MNQQDLFSKQAATYAKFRPDYPKELYDYLYQQTANRVNAWDCGAGNGQVAHQLAKVFEQVIATDISQKQLEQAVQQPNIHYQVMPAEKTSFASQSFDLITVAQALHWFQFDDFFKEVHRVLKIDGTFATWLYSLLRVNENIDPIISHYYHDIIGPYWAAQRAHIDQAYANIVFPFDQITRKTFTATFEWTVEEMMGYLHSWSSTQTYIKQHAKNPISLIEDTLRQQWGTAKLPVHFPIDIIIGKGI